MKNKNVYVLTRTGDGDVIVDGVFTTEKKAIDFRNSLLEDFGVSLEDWEEGQSEYDFEIHCESLI